MRIKGTLAHYYGEWILSTGGIDKAFGLVPLGYCNGAFIPVTYSNGNNRIYSLEYCRT